MGVEQEHPVGVAVAVVRHEGRLLIGPRGAGQPLAGMWEFPGGKVRPGEDLCAAAVRECLEETGIRVVVQGKYASVDHVYEHGLVRIHFFDCRPVDPLESPRDPYRWVAASDLAEYRFPPANDAIVRQLSAGRIFANRSR